MVHQHVHNVLEEVGLIGTEETSSNLVNGLLQLRDVVVICIGIISDEIKSIYQDKNYNHKRPKFFKLPTYKNIT